MTKKALLIIDMQNDYYPGGKWSLEGIESAGANAARLLANSRQAGETVVHVRHEFPDADAPFFVSGSEGAEIHRDVRPIAGETVVLKNQINSFRDTDLKALLEERGIDELVICGSMSHWCIDAGTRAASDLGYPCTLIHDACATRDLEFEGTVLPARQVHAAFMGALDGAYARVVSTDSYLRELADAA